MRGRDARADGEHRGERLEAVEPRRDGSVRDVEMDRVAEDDLRVAAHAGDGVREEDERPVHPGSNGLPRRSAEHLRARLPEDDERCAGLDDEVEIDRVAVDEARSERDDADARGARSGEGGA